MKAILLDKRIDGSAGVCFLSKVFLADYVEALSESYQDYEIQREIVANTYLDHLVDTVLARKHIPSIVLIAESAIEFPDGTLEVAKFKIIDGLQRTFRLQAIDKTITYLLANADRIQESAGASKFTFSQRFSADLRAINSSTSLLRAVLAYYETHGAAPLRACLSDNSQWFEIWTGLSPDEEVRKMLTLNAGHKPVKTRHQLELLFLYLLPGLRSSESSNFKLVREKEVSAPQFSKGREVGEFHFAHVITALLSFAKRKPVAPSTSLIQQINEEEDIGENIEVIRPDFLGEVIDFLVKMDRAVSSEYGPMGTLWFGREVVLAGILGALGAYTAKESTPANSAFDKLLSKLHANPGLLNIDEFEIARNSLDLSKVNIGNANRTAIYRSTSDILYDRVQRVNWLQSFSGAAS